MSGFEEKFRQRVATAECDALAELVQGNPQLTLKELGVFVDAHPALEGVTLGALGLASNDVHAKPDVAKPDVAKPVVQAKPDGQSKPVGQSVLPQGVALIGKAEARMAYDRQVQQAIADHGDWISAEALAPLVGGLPAERSASLRRLCGEGILEWTGVSRGTKYRITAR